LLALGFYELEEWGVWSRTDSPILVLPFFVSGLIELSITAMGHGLNIDREITISIGNASAKILLSPNLRETSIILDITSPSRKVEFGNVLAMATDGMNDPRTMGIGIYQLSIKGLSQARNNWGGEAVFVDLADEKDDQLQFGCFNKREEWGIWSQTPECCILLPYSVSGACEIQIFAQTFGSNSGREICLILGDSEVRFIAEEKPKQYIFQFNPTQSSSLLIFSGLVPESTSTDPRTLGIGIHRLQMTRPADVGPVSIHQSLAPRIEKQPKVKKKLNLDAYSLNKRDVVYSALFSEKSDNSDWQDVITAFVWSFRDDKNAVLIVNNSSASVASFFSHLMFLFYRIGEMKCRIIAIHSLNMHSDVDAVISTSHVYVHTDTSIPLENGLSKIQDSDKISILSSSEYEKFTEDATVVIKPNRRPKKKHGSLYGVEKDLEYVLDWYQLVGALQTAHGMLVERSK
jgi:hypothetical protein